MTAAADLRVGDVTPAVPLNGDATILFVYPYTDQTGKARVFVAYTMPDGWVDSTSFLAAAEIPLTSRAPDPNNPPPSGWPDNGCPRFGCPDFYAGVGHIHP